MVDKERSTKRKRKERKTTDLCKLKRKNPNFVPELPFNPVVIYSPDDCEEVSLREEGQSQREGKGWCVK